MGLLLISPTVSVLLSNEPREFSNQGVKAMERGKGGGGIRTHGSIQLIHNCPLDCNHVKRLDEKNESGGTWRGLPVHRGHLAGGQGRPARNQARRHVSLRTTYRPSLPGHSPVYSMM